MTASLETIDGKYELLAEIGSGGFGTVYKARHIQFARLVAIKVLQSGAVDEESRARFMREAKILSSVKNKSIPVFYGYGTWKSSPYMVMELLDGMDLERWLAVNRDREIGLKLSILRQMCDGLACAHQNDVIHRDLKPSNIIVLAANDESPDLSIKVIDFGLARFAPGSGLSGQQLTGAGSAVGTVEYMSPEQCRGESIDRRSDIYSAGCILFQCMVGRPPFSGETFVDVMMKHVQESPEELVVGGLEGSEKFSRCLQETIDACMAKDPGERYQTMYELEEEIRRLEQAYRELPLPVRDSLVIQTKSRSDKAQGHRSDDRSATQADAGSAARKPMKTWLPAALLVLVVCIGCYFSSPFGIANLANAVLSVGQAITGAPDCHDPRILSWCVSMAGRSVNGAGRQALLRNVYAAALSAHVPFDQFVEIASVRLRCLRSNDPGAYPILKQTEKHLLAGYPEVSQDKAKLAQLAMARTKFFLEFDRENRSAIINDSYFLAIHYNKAGDRQQSKRWATACLDIAKREKEPGICMQCHEICAEHASAALEESNALYHLSKALSCFSCADWFDPSTLQAMALTLSGVDKLSYRGALNSQLKEAQREVLEHEKSTQSVNAKFVAQCLLSYLSILLDEKTASVEHMEAALKLVSDSPQILQETIGTRVMLANVETRLGSALFRWGLDDDADRLFERLTRSTETQLSCVAEYAYGRCLFEHGLADEAVPHLQAAHEMSVDYGARFAPPDTDEFLRSAVASSKSRIQIDQLLSAIVVSEDGRRKVVREVFKNVGMPAPTGLRMTELADQITDFSAEQKLYASLLGQKTGSQKPTDEEFVDSLVNLCAARYPSTEANHETQETKRKGVDAQLKRLLLKQLAGGLSRQQVVNEFVCSRIFTARLAWSFYWNMLGRWPADEELEYWIKIAHENGNTMIEIRRCFLSTPEGLHRCVVLNEPFPNFTYRVLADGKPSASQVRRLNRIYKRCCQIDKELMKIR